jgi:hypothetical protein
MTVASTIGMLFIAVVVFLAAYWTYRPPEPPPADNDHPVSILFELFL